MSLLNQVLNDLDRRGADANLRGALPRDVRPLPPKRELPVRKMFLLTVLAIIVGAGGAIAGIVLWRDRPLPLAPDPLVINALNAAVSTMELAAPLTSVAIPAPPLSPATSGPEVGSQTGRTRADSSVAPATPDKARLPTLRLSTDLSESVSEPAMGHEKPATEPPRLPAEVPTDTGAIEKTVLDASPHERADRLYRTALGLMSQGNFQDASSTLRVAIKEDPRHVAARQTLIKYYLDTGASASAQGLLEIGLKTNPDQVTWVLPLARLKIDAKDFLGALSVLETHAPTAGQNASYQGSMGAVLQRLNRHGEAKSRFFQATEMEAANGRWWIGLAMAHEAQGESSEARTNYAKALATPGLNADLRAFAEAKLK